MLKIGRFPVLILLSSVILFYGWSWLFESNTWLKVIGINVLQIIGGTLSCLWLFGAYRVATKKKKGFWLLLGLGVMVYLCSNWIWLYFQITEKSIEPADSLYTLWLIAYVLFLAALIVKTKETSAAYSENSYTFNIVVYMITATAVSIHFLIGPVLEFAGNSWMIIAVTIAYPIADLSILFVVTILYYLHQRSKEKDILLLVIIGFLIQILADTLYAYQSINGSYLTGNFVDLLWLIALLFIGFAGLSAKDSHKVPAVEIKNIFEKREFLFPYMSILILLALVIYSYHWDFNALSLGLLVTFLMVIGRQLVVIQNNNKLVKEYKYLAYHDQLTGLSNRVCFIEDIEKLVEKSHEYKMALLLIDLDRFKLVNDTMGHYVGDIILKKTSNRLRDSLPVGATIYRMGGDEFVVILPHSIKDNSEIVAETILQNFKNPFVVYEYEINLTPSIGISLFPENGTTSEELMKNADAAMYVSKVNGKNNFSFYNTELNNIMMRKMNIENELKKALEKKELSLVYQPKVDLRTRETIGMEALLRWQHPDLGSVSPVEFIPVAEETGQIVQIGEWVLKEACKQNKRWQEKGLPPLCISVNVSVLQFQHGEFLKTVKNALEESNMDAEYLELEITESIMQNIKESIEILGGLKKLGIKTSMDDFGTGYSSLHILQSLPIDTIKIDKSFIDDIRNTGRQSMVKTIIDLGLNLNLNVVAEGIEHEHQIDALIESNCLIGQGYLFSKPINPEEFEELLEKMELQARSKPVIS